MSCLETIRGKAGRTRLAFLFVFLATGAAAAQSADAGWELRFCADPNAWPFSSADEPGFENGIAALVADELGATLTTDWHRQDESMVRDRLNGGECDVIAGVPDEIDGLTHTVAYYSSPYVFVYRDDLPLSQPLTLDSPDLADLRIGAQVEAMPPHEGLLTRGRRARGCSRGSPPWPAAIPRTCSTSWTPGVSTLPWPGGRSPAPGCSGMTATR